MPRGKLNRGILAVSTYKQAAKAEQQTPENLKLAHYLGWCIEMVRNTICLLVYTLFDFISVLNIARSVVVVVFVVKTKILYIPQSTICGNDSSWLDS